MSNAAGPSHLPPPPLSTMRRDLLSAYAASGAKVLSWVIVSAIVFRFNLLHYALLALVRGTTGLLNYTTLGLAPAMIRVAASRLAPTPVATLAPAVAAEGAAAPVLEYRNVGADADADPDLPDGSLRVLYSSALLVALVSAALGLVLTVAYLIGFRRLHDVPVQVSPSALLAVVLGIGAGTVFRLLSEAPGAVAQMRDRIARDNAFIAAAELSWPAFTLALAWPGGSLLTGAGWGYAASGALLLVLRFVEAERHTRLISRGIELRFDAATVRQLLALGSLVAVAQLADFLYAPTDYVLINRLISPGTVGRYAPAVQIDAGLLLLVGALSAVLLPKAAQAHAAADVERLRRYYVRGTLAGAGMLLVAGIVVYVLSPLIFRLWLGDPLPQTQAILPLVLVHTVLGGASAVGRSILLGIGKVKPFAVAALVAGVANVVLSYTFVAYFQLGLKGIVYGTIVAVVGRTVLWQPWYVMRTLRRASDLQREPVGAV